PEAEEEPEYEVEAPSGSEAEPGGVQPIAEWPPGGPIAYLLTPEQVAIIALGLIAITAVALVARRRKKTINFY
ncbi:MAG TPA: LPXTG cell wall anchor domain-containing protein, partial [Candidatus Bathyarchaeota archaeon]|nr:LPXTG cell wall anchor domain-containing protein [Candidatus Bathyarchaeota archaeon]